MLGPDPVSGAGAKGHQHLFPSVGVRLRGGDVRGLPLPREPALQSQSSLPLCPAQDSVP